jgi:hypothetical protein
MAVLAGKLTVTGKSTLGPWQQVPILDGNLRSSI